MDTDAGLIEAGQWTGRRWAFFLAAVFIVQLALVFWLREKTPIRPRTALPVPPLKMSNPEAAEFYTLPDPALFALPHREGFSGIAWLKAPPLRFQPFDWNEPPRWLALPAETLGASFRQILDTNASWTLLNLAVPEPELNVSAPSGPPITPARSSFRISGELRDRKLLQSFELPAWPGADLLTNTVVQVLVNAEGIPVSPAVLVSSGFRPADELAVEKAVNCRFEPVRNFDPNGSPLVGLTLGEIVFEWQTLPLTNAPAANL
jgi:hypothetical protein